MEISKVSPTSVKLKGKNASVVIDPMSKIDAEIVIKSSPSEALALDKVENIRLIVSGPGEYEAGGISITGRPVKDGVIYVLLDQVKVLFTLSSTIGSVPDDEEYDCLLIKINSVLSKDTIAPINTKCVVLFGDPSLSGLNATELEKTPKVNLKKTAEIQGKTFFMV